MKPAVLFLCTANSCRSQMAEGLARHHLGGLFDFFSAGTRPTMIDPRAIETMNEIGIDISGQQSKSLKSLSAHSFDLVVTLCGDARDTCPIYPGETHLEHMEFDNPAGAEGSEEEVREEFRRIRQEMEKRLIPYLRTLHPDL